MIPDDPIGVLVGLFALAVVAATAFSYGNSKRKDETISAQRELLATYEQRDDLHSTQLNEMKRLHEREMAELNARIDVLQSDWVSSLGVTVAREVTKAVASTLATLIAREERERGR